MDKSNSMQRLLKIFGIERPEGAEEEEAAGTSSAPTMGQANNPSPDAYEFPPLPTAAELEAMFPERNYRKTSPELQNREYSYDEIEAMFPERSYTREYSCEEEESKPPEDAVRRLLSRPMLGKRISRPFFLGRQAMLPGDRVRRRLLTVEEEEAAHKRHQALRRDRQQRKDLAPEPYRESTKLDETCASDALRLRLAELGASTPTCVFVDEVSKEQAMAASKYGRFSMYADRRGRHVAEIFTDDEFDGLVPNGYDEPERGMPVFDREGRRYDFEFTYSEEHWYYRLTGVAAEYQRFMAGNNVVRDVVELGKKMIMKVFAFRSQKLLPEDNGFRNHPDGALGMIIIFSESEDEDEYAEWIELDDDSITVKEMVEHIQQNQKAA